MSQMLTWEKPGQDEDRFKRYIVLALSRSGVCVMLEDDKSDYLFVANLLPHWQLAKSATPKDEDIFGEELAKRLQALKQNVRSGGGADRIDATLEDDKFVQFIVEPIAGENGETDIMTVIVDLTEERRRETVLRALLREVSHRSKNLMAIIQSIASQTAKNSKGIPDFLDKFRGRLYSLSKSQDLVTESDWQGARFSSLLNDQTSKYLTVDGNPITLTGDDPVLSANAAIHIGLAIHELIANATVNNSIDAPNPRFTVECKVADGADGKEVDIRWYQKLSGSRQPDGDDQLQLDPAPFSTVVLERIVPTAVGGTAYYLATDNEVDYRLSFPLIN